MSEARTAVFPETTLQTGIVHLIRHSLDFANWKERQPMATALRPIDTAVNAEAARAALDAFERGPWGRRCPTIVASWRRAWTHVIPFFAFPPAVRRLIYTTNSLESVHAPLRTIIKTRGHSPNDAAATKLIGLPLRNITATWARTAYDWRPAMNQFAIRSEGRFSPSTAYNALAHGRCAHTHPSCLEEEKTERRQPALHTKIRTVPTDRLWGSDIIGLPRLVQEFNGFGSMVHGFGPGLERLNRTSNPES